jgi:hypothetical protein
MDIESVNVIEPYGRFFFLRFSFSRLKHHHNTRIKRYRFAHEYKSEQKQLKKNIRLK